MSGRLCAASAPAKRASQSREAEASGLELAAALVPYDFSSTFVLLSTRTSPWRQINSAPTGASWLAGQPTRASARATRLLDCWLRSPSSCRRLLLAPPLVKVLFMALGSTRAGVWLSD